MLGQDNGGPGREILLTLDPVVQSAQPAQQPDMEAWPLDDETVAGERWQGKVSNDNGA